MTAEYFIDTNVLLYFISKAPGEQAKAQRAAEILMQDGIGLSVQVLSEFYINATQKSAVNLPHGQVMTFMETLRHVPTASLSREEALAAADLAHRHKLSYWDAAIVIAAQSLQCSVLYTEDLQHDRRFDRLRVINPFR